MFAHGATTTSLGQRPVSWQEKQTGGIMFMVIRGARVAREPS